jgi:hypothetical protein
MSYDPNDHIPARSDFAVGLGIWLALLACLAVSIQGLPGASILTGASLDAKGLSTSGVQHPSSSTASRC